jgi:hypothetical protein
MIPFISLYGGDRSVIVDGDRDIRRCRSARVIIIQIILLAVFVFLGSLLEEFYQTKAQWRRPLYMDGARALGCAIRRPTV